MSSARRAFPSAPPAAVFAIVILSGVAAGALDLAFAITFYGLQGSTATEIPQGIARGALAERAGELGVVSVTLGAFFHFFISATAAMIYYAAARRFQLLTRRPLLCGAVFGVLMYLAMRLIVLPLSHIGFAIPKWGNIVGELCSHVFLFGWVIALGVVYAERLRIGRGCDPHAGISA